MAPKRSWTNYPATYQAEEIAIIADWIAAGESGAIVGPPGAGKSNLFGFLSRRPDVFKVYLSTDDFRLVLALVDLNNLPGSDLATFYRIMLRALYESRDQLAALGEPLAEVVETLYRSVVAQTDPFVCQSALREALLAFERHDAQLVFLLDPFDRLAQTAEPQILDNLRGLRDSFKSTLSYLVGIQQTLGYLRDPAEMGELYALLDTHLCWVGGMSAADARFVIGNVTRAMGRALSEAEIKHLIELTGGYASFLKAAGLWLARIATPPAPEQWVATWLAEPSFQSRLQVLWQNLTGEEQLILTELQSLPPQPAAHQSFTDHYPQILSQLEAKQICQRAANGHWQIFSPLLAAYIEQLGLIDTGKIHYRPGDDVILRGSRSLERELTPQSRQLLLFFLNNPRRIVNKEEIVIALWPDDEIYDKGFGDERLHKAVSQLRQVLEIGDDAPRYIKTEHRKGYRFFPEGAPRGWDRK